MDTSTTSITPRPESPLPTEFRRAGTLPPQTSPPRGTSPSYQAHSSLRDVNAIATASLLAGRGGSGVNVTPSGDGRYAADSTVYKSTLTSPGNVTSVVSGVSNYISTSPSRYSVAPRSSQGNAGTMQVYTGGDATEGATNEAYRDRLLRDAQLQVRELIPYKEQCNHLRSDIAELKGRNAQLEEECRKLRRTIDQEQDDKLRSIDNLNNKTHSLEVMGEGRVRRLEERMKDQQQDMIGLTREIERKQRMIKALEEEVAIAKREKQVEQEEVLRVRAQTAAVENQVAKLEGQLAEVSKGAVRADATKTEYERRLQSTDSDFQNLKRDMEHLRKKKTELQDEIHRVVSDRDALQSQVSNLTHELEVVPRLRDEINSLLSSREEITALRRTMDESDIAVANERSTRRTLELERDQFVLQIRSLEVDMKRMEDDLHRAQVDAAEKLTIKRENEELKDALQVSNQTSNNLQDQLLEMRQELTSHSNEYASLSGAISKEGARLRQFVEKALVTETFYLQGDDEDDSGQADGDDYNDDDLSDIGLDTSKSSTQHDSHRYGTVNTTPRRSPSSKDKKRKNKRLGMAVVHFTERSPRHGPLNESSEAVFLPLRRLCEEMAVTLHEEKSKRQNLSKLLQSERESNSELQDTVRKSHTTTSQKQARLTELEGDNNSLRSKISLLESELERVSAEGRSQINHLAKVLSITGTSEVLDVSYSVILSTLQAALHKRDLLDKKCTDLEDDMSGLTRKLKETQIQYTKSTQELQDKHMKFVAELEAKHEHFQKETSVIQQGMKESIRTAISRHESLSSEHTELKERYQGSLVDLRTVREKLTAAEDELEVVKKDVVSLATRLKSEEGQKKDVMKRLDDSTAELNTTVLRAAEVRGELQKEEQKCEKYYCVSQLLGKAVLGFKQKAALLLEQRASAIQLYKVYETNFNELVTETSGGAPSVRARITLRVLGLAALASVRMKRIAKQHQSRRVLDGSPVAVGRRARGSSFAAKRRGHMEIPFADVACPSRQELHVAIYDSDLETVETFLSQFDADRKLKAEADRGNLLRLASGLTRSRFAPVGPSARARSASLRHKQALKDSAEQKLHAERSFHNVRSENSHLVAMVEMKEAQNQKFSSEIAQLLSEKSRMIDSRQHEVLESELQRTKSSLDREKEERKSFEDKLQQLRAREMDMLLHQNTLQNEARSLAMEVANKTNTTQSQLTNSSYGGGVSPTTGNIAGGSAYYTQTQQQPPASRSSFRSSHHGMMYDTQSLDAMVVQSEGDADSVVSLGVRTPADSSKVPRQFASTQQQEPQQQQHRYGYIPPTHMGIQDMGETMPPASPQAQQSIMSSSPQRSPQRTPTADNLLRMIRGMDDRISGALTQR